MADNRGRAALRRGPLAYCVEERDSESPLDAIVLPDEFELEARHDPGLLSGAAAIPGPGFTAILYDAWANRGPGPMQVWLRNGRR